MRLRLDASLMQSPSRICLAYCLNLRGPKCAPQRGQTRGDSWSMAASGSVAGAVAGTLLQKSAAKCAVSPQFSACGLAPSRIALVAVGTTACSDTRRRAEIRRGAMRTTGAPMAAPPTSPTSSTSGFINSFTARTYSFSLFTTTAPHSMQFIQLPLIAVVGGTVVIPT